MASGEVLLPMLTIARVTSARSSDPRPETSGLASSAKAVPARAVAAVKKRRKSRKVTSFINIRSSEPRESWGDFLSGATIVDGQLANRPRPPVGPQPEKGQNDAA